MQNGQLQKNVSFKADPDDSGLRLKKLSERHEDEIAQLKQKHQQEIEASERNERKLLSKVDRYSHLLEAAPDPIVIYDTEGRVEYVNRSFTLLFGWTEEDLLKRRLDFVPEKNQPETEKAVQKLLTGEKVTSLLTQRYTKEKKILDVEVSADTFRDGAEKMIGSFVILRDITERLRAESKIYHLNEELQEKSRLQESLNISLKKAAERANFLTAQAEEANSLKSQFLANMSHEIRTPMNGVIGFTDMLLDTALDETQIDYAQTIKRSANSLLSLINDILDFSKIEAGQMDFEAISFDPELIVYDVCELILPKIGQKPIEILCSVGDNVPPYLEGDPTRFRQVLTNLMGNAPKFTEEGEIELSLEVEEETESQVKLHAKIRDTGIGIPEEQLEEIFEAFKQADGSTTRMYGGTGLGLSICKRIATLLNGDVWAESKQTEGSTFHFSAWMKKSDEKKSKRYKPVSLSGRTAIIVDDNLTNLKIAHHNLESAGMEIHALTNAQDVVPKLEALYGSGKTIDVGILDIQMPEISGYQLAQQIRNAEAPFSLIPLIALSSVMGHEARKCENAGFTGFLSKPARKEKLYQMLEKVIAEKPELAEIQKIKTQYSIREETKHSLHILLVEDNPTNQKLANLMLTKAGYIVTVVNNGKEAVDRFVAAPETFDLIFMDLQMPVMDGKDATSVIRKQGFHQIPIIAMTAHAMKGDREACLEVGMNDYVSKPISRKAVFDILETWIFNKDASLNPE